MLNTGIGPEVWEADVKLMMTVIELMSGDPEPETPTAVMISG